MVLVSHQYALSGLTEPVVANFESLGGIAVVIFFSISGYLICLSGIRSSDFISFMSKRCRRIFPALVPCAILVFVILGIIISLDMKVDYSMQEAFYKIVGTITLHNVDSSNLASNFIYKSGMLGSLWSLPVEFSCYLIVGLCVSSFNTPKVYPVLFSIFFIASLYTLKTGYNDFFFNVPTNLFVTRGMCFFLGASLAMSINSWNHTNVKIFIIAIVAIYFYTTTPLIDRTISGYILLCVLTIFIGVSFNDKFIDGKFDYSYGIYIYAFPVQQICINYLSIDFYLNMLISTMITVVISALSWHFIEKPCLSRSRKDYKPLADLAQQRT